MYTLSPSYLEHFSNILRTRLNTQIEWHLTIVEQEKGLCTVDSERAFKKKKKRPLLSIHTTLLDA